MTLYQTRLYFININILKFSDTFCPFVGSYTSKETKRKSERERKRKGEKKEKEWVFK